ncbi:MAG: pseudouridine-5'-phosphate glycosidase [Sphaerochaetaceae bacterium]|nr:pseudouridine-5'-phosphate glycosidase [Sphaerochaetaceae bacterium]
MNQYLDISPEIRKAQEAKMPIVALESTIISHGMPYPKNVETALLVEKTVRDAGAVPATLAIIHGRLKVGLSGDELEYFGKKGPQITKASRRDIPYLVANKQDGATTVAATMIIAALAGIEVFATGGIGGVHREAQTTWDVSADMEELVKSPVIVVCAGAKAILDLKLTLEYLETKGVNVIGYRTDDLPAFYSRESGLNVTYRLDTPEQIAALWKAQKELGLGQGVLVTNPIPEKMGMDKNYIEAKIQMALAEMKRLGIHGKDTTPYLLDKIQKLTEGSSLESNISLVLNNARLAAAIAVALN